MQQVTIGDKVSCQFVDNAIIMYIGTELVLLKGIDGHEWAIHKDEPVRVSAEIVEPNLKKTFAESYRNYAANKCPDYVDSKCPAEPDWIPFNETIYSVRPVPSDYLIELKLSDGRTVGGAAGEFSWRKSNRSGSVTIVAYRVLTNE